MWAPGIRNHEGPASASNSALFMTSTAEVRSRGIASRDFNASIRSKPVKATTTSSSRTLMSIAIVTDATESPQTCCDAPPDGLVNAPGRRDVGRPK